MYTGARTGDSEKHLTKGGVADEKNIYFPDDILFDGGHDSGWG
jgi:hypothetical protein